jgi:hypothetical protein
VRFVPTGVRVTRTVATGQGGLQATVTDRFESTDGAGHAIGLSYGEEEFGAGEGPSYRFPGEAGFAQRAEGASAPAGTSAPETIYFQVDPEAAEPANGLENPLGAITLSTVPDRVHFVEPEVFELLYANRAVPSSGALTFTQVLSQALTTERVEELAAHAEDALAGPSVSITSPGTTSVATPTVTVAGTAADNFGVAALSVDGQALPYVGAGPWSTTVSLTPGPNTITATAVDHTGNIASSSIVVTYVRPTLAGARVTAAGGKVHVSLECRGLAGSACAGQIALTSIERVSRGRIRAVIARVRSHQVGVGAARLTIPAGSRMTIAVALSSTGRRLLARFRRLPLSVTIRQIGGAGATLRPLNTIVTPPRGRRRHRHG